MDTRVYNQVSIPNSLQVSMMGDIPSGKNYKPGRIFLVKNNTEEDLEVTIVPASQDTEITTTLYVGWNPELVKEVKNAPEGLQYGL